MFENVNNTNGSQRDSVNALIILFFGRFRFAQGPPRAVADVQNVNLTFAHGEKYPVFVLAATMENFTDCCIEKFALWRERTAFGKKFQRTNRVVKAVEPTPGGIWRPLRQPQMGLRDVLPR